ncbi:MAG: hypothetical protein PHY79_20740 [Anaerolineae bacterium]|jgi:hypothetical protein|nr:hypothetical protein [Anaerolineae bacterium]
MIPLDLARHRSPALMVSAVWMILLVMGHWSCSTGGLEVQTQLAKDGSELHTPLSQSDLTNAQRSVPGQGYDIVVDYAAVEGPPLAHGTNVWWTEEDAEMWTARWAELSPSHVRVPVFHAILEPQNDNNDPNETDWSGFLFETPIVVAGEPARSLTYKGWFEALRSMPDVNVVLYFPYLAPWLSKNDPIAGFPIPAAPHPPNDLAEYREFVTAILRYLVESIGLPATRITVEVTNEPDLLCGVDPATACFWEDWTMDDIAGVVQATYEAVRNVDEDIELVGLAECQGTGVVRELMDNYPQGRYLDGLSFHYYSPSGFKLNPVLGRARELAPYGRPLYLDEYGSRQFLSEGKDGALWHSWALVTLWNAGIAPLQYPISEYPLIGEPYNSMGLFENWLGEWSRKPSYWVFANFFRHMGHDERLACTAPSDMDILAARRVPGQEVQVAFWVVNRGDSPLVDRTFAVSGFPGQEATLFVYDNLASLAPVLSMSAAGSPLVFTATLPARSSYTFVIRKTTDLYLPVILRRDVRPR